MKHSRLPKDLSGQSFGELKAIELADKRGAQGQRFWSCECSCGLKATVMQQSLLSGNTKTCGDKNNHPRYDRNRYILAEDHALLDVSTPSLPDCFTKVDIEDLPKILSVRQRWLAHDSSGFKRHYWGLYVVASDRKTRLHRFIAGAESTAIMVDHINGDTLDNRKHNLRLVGAGENSRNTRKKIDNKTGFTGVWFCKNRNAYMAEITSHGAKLSLGAFNTADEANIAYRAAAKALGFSERHGL